MFLFRLLLREFYCTERSTVRCIQFFRCDSILKSHRYVETRFVENFVNSGPGRRYVDNESIG